MGRRRQNNQGSVSPLGSTFGGWGNFAQGVGNFLGNLMTPASSGQQPQQQQPQPQQAPQNQGREVLFNRMQVPLGNPNMGAAMAARNSHMQKANDMASATNAAVASTMRQNANRVTANRMKQMELAAAQAAASGEHARANAIAEQARQDALARQYEAAEKTKRMVQAMRML